MKRLSVISLGGGVQSSVMALIASEGAFCPMPDCAIFADTHWEPPSIYAHLDWLAGQLRFPLYVVDNGRSLREGVKALTNHSGNRNFVDLPVYLKGRNGQSDGMGRRQCTEHYKIAPVRRKLRELLGLSKRQRVPSRTTVELWLGISTDESIRMRTSRDRWIRNRYPLIEAGCPGATAWRGGKPATTGLWSVRPVSAVPISPATDGSRRRDGGRSCSPRRWRSTPILGGGWPSPRSPICILCEYPSVRRSASMSQGWVSSGGRMDLATSAKGTVESEVCGSDR